MSNNAENRCGADVFERFTSGTQARLTDALSGFAPDVARYIKSFVFGEIYARRGLTDQEKTIAVITPIASLTPSSKCCLMQASHAFSMRSLKPRPSSKPAACACRMQR